MANIHDLLPQDVAYLRFKGVFSIPSEPVCHALLTAYFHHVHPILPVVDAAAVLTTFRNGGAVALNVLLLWSMFSVAANVSANPSPLSPLISDATMRVSKRFCWVCNAY